MKYLEKVKEGRFSESFEFRFSEGLSYHKRAKTKIENKFMAGFVVENH